MIKKFSEILKIINGKNQKKVESEHGKYPIYGSGGVMGRADESLCPRDTVVIGRKGNINNPLFVEEPFWNVDTAFGLVADQEQLMPKYLYYFCKNFNFQSLSTTVTIPSLTKANLLNIQLSLPTMDIQKVVVNKLDKISILVDQYRGLLGLYDSIVKSRFIEMFGDTNNSMEWPIANVESIAKVKVGLVIKPTRFYSSSPTRYKAIRGLNISPFCINDTNWVYFTEDGAKSNKKTEVKENDVVVVRSGAPGTAAVVTKEYAGSNAIDVLIVEPDLTQIDPTYLCAYTNFPHGLKQISKGSG
ncbi:restriction endonuclease subunit S, partial [Faecalibaculum rodentium]